MSENSRSHETTVTIDAPIEEVWKALTQADSAQRWFAPRMTTEPFVGGRFVADWGPGLEWKTTVEAIDPLRHLRLVETRDRMLSAAPATAEQLRPCRLVQDFYVETEQGKTVVRLVHSGFGTEKEWDGEYEGTRQGWRGVFVRLRLSLERHRDATVFNFIVPALCPSLTPPEAMAELRSMIPGSTSLVCTGPTEFVGIVEEWNGSVINASAQQLPQGTMLYLEVLLFGLAADTAKQIEWEWRSKLSTHFPAAVENTAQ